MENKLKNSSYFWDMAVRFLSYYLQDIRRSSPNTIVTYKNCLNRYIDYLEEEKRYNRKNVCFQMFNREHLNDYMAWMKRTNKFSPKTCNLRLTSIHSFLEYASNESNELIALYLASRSIKGVRVQQKPIEFLEEIAISTLLKTPDLQKKSERRNQMLLIFLYDTAARISEALNVRLCDLHMKATNPYVTFLGKGLKYRNVPLMKKTQDHITHYMHEFHEGDSDSKTPFFYAVAHGIKHKLSTDTPEKMLKKYAQQASKVCKSIPKRVHCHMIRKTRAMNLYQEGVPLAHIQQLLGHSSISTTSGFYVFATLKTLAKSLEKSNPSEVKKSWGDEDVLKKLYRL